MAWDGSRWRAWAWAWLGMGWAWDGAWETKRGLELDEQPGSANPFGRWPQSLASPSTGNGQSKRHQRHQSAGGTVPVGGKPSLSMASTGVTRNPPHSSARSDRTHWRMSQDAAPWRSVVGCCQDTSHAASQRASISPDPLGTLTDAGHPWGSCSVAASLLTTHNTTPSILGHRGGHSTLFVGQSGSR